jgi:hypothetical protein
MLPHPVSTAFIADAADVYGLRAVRFATRNMLVCQLHGCQFASACMSFLCDAAAAGRRSHPNCHERSMLPVLKVINHTKASEKTGSCGVLVLPTHK